MTDRFYYKHDITGAIAEHSERFAAVFGDVLVRVDGPNEAEATPSPKKRSTRKPSEDASPTDSSKEGNN